MREILNIQRPNIVTRIAPTPSGHLHLGNILNFLITWIIAKKNNGIIHLRIDDMDIMRTKITYVEEIINTLKWLEMDYDLGPQTLNEYQSSYRQTVKQKHYLSYALKLIKFNNAYVCQCSRKELVSNTHPYNCQKKAYSFSASNNSIRMLDKLDDFIIWRSDNIPSYQLVSTIEDHEMDINVIVRGEDLLDSSKRQQEIAKRLKLSSFEQKLYIHHPLIMDRNGQKLSKSSYKEKALINKYSRNDILKELGDILKFKGKIKTINDFLK